MNDKLHRDSLLRASASAGDAATDERLLSISAVAIETGLSKETLRKWEDRYGFPQPERRAAGRRLYPLWQVAQLFEIKRRLDAGARPADVVPEHWRKAVSGRRDEPVVPRPKRPIVMEAIQAVADGDGEVLRRLLERDLEANGLRPFVANTVAELCGEIGEAWCEGRIRVHHEHMFSEIVGDMLDDVTRSVAATAGLPRVMLTTVPGELHTLGLRMVRALFTDAGGTCIFLGAQTPLAEIVDAVECYRIEVVGLSFSRYFPRRQFVPVVHELRASLPSEVKLWIGGGGARRARRLEAGIQVFSALEQAVAAMTSLRSGGPH